VHIFDFDADIYGLPIEVQFFKKLRDEQKFPSVEVLKEQLARDKDKSLNYFLYRPNQIL